MKVLIVGCGAMGSWFARLLRNKGYELLLYDVHKANAAKLARLLNARALSSLVDVKGIEGALLAVPIEETPYYIKYMSSVLNGDGWLVEIASFKTPLQRALKSARERGLLCVSIHPLFGPRTPNLRGTVTAHVSPSDKRRERRLLSRLMGPTRIVEVDFKTHDEAMGIAISLTHLLGITFSALLVKSPRNVEKLITKSMRAALYLSAIAMKEPESFYDSYAMNNPVALKYYRKFLKTYSEAVHKLRSSRKLMRPAEQVNERFDLDRLYRELYKV